MENKNKKQLNLEKQEKNNKNKTKLFSIIFILGIVLFMTISFVSSLTYCSVDADCSGTQTCDKFTGTCKTTSPMDFWSVFVEQTFGNFWYAVIGLAMLYFIILLMGRVSMYSVLGFMLMFFVCMSIGYGYPLLTVVLAAFIITKFVYDVFWFIGAKII